MDLEAFKLRREQLQEKGPKYRVLCRQCVQPDSSCYCEHIQRFDPKIKFAILIHPIEQRRRIATGRMAHLCLENSELIEGHEYSENPTVNRILQNPSYQPVVLYPGHNALNLSDMSVAQRENLFDCKKTPVIFVIDGTWATARKTMNLSPNLKSLPQLCFTPPHESRFRVRKQPGINCLSTIEAIHHTIELLGARDQLHDRLMHVFDKMVERQLDFIRDAFENPRTTSYRRPRHRFL